MKSLRYLSASLALCGLIGGANAFADGRNVTVVNQTSYTLVSFYASSSNAAGWDTSSDLLGGQTVPAGGQTTIPIAGNGGEDNCQYDLMGVLDGASQAAYQYQVNACDGDTWTITP